MVQIDAFLSGFYKGIPLLFQQTIEGFWDRPIQSLACIENYELIMYGIKNVGINQEGDHGQYKSKHKDILAFLLSKMYFLERTIPKL